MTQSESKIDRDPTSPCFDATIGEPPRDRNQLWHLVHDHMGLEIARQPVCRGHHSPWDYFSTLYLDRPPIALVLGPRGGGKSYLSALDTHIRSRSDPGHGTRILGGSRSQSAQIQEALRGLLVGGVDAAMIEQITKNGARYRNGSDVAILSASSTSVRGPHVPSLKLDEVDEISGELFEAAFGMCMNRREMSGSVVMTSTWHRVGGPMTGLMERAEAGEFPLHRFCAFEVLERCPEERSGPNLELCPDCPLISWCHEGRDDDPEGRPKAKRADGHYAIDSLIQKAHATSIRTFESDYLCRGPKADGLWFPGWDESANLDELAEYDPALPAYLAVDPGVFTGAVFFQVGSESVPDGSAPVDVVRVFADHLAENVPAEQNARQLMELARVRCNGRIEIAWCDPAGGSRTPIGPTVLAEYERGGLRGLRPWPRAMVADGLALVDSFAQPADGRSRLRLHPRCVRLSQALRNYRRARRGGQWQDYPEDPQHPFEDLVDALRGGLVGLYPEGRRPRSNLARVSARRVF